MTECLIVGVGGFIGSVCRYLIGLVPYEHSSGFPLQTFFINIIGAFLIGLVAALAARNSLHPRLALFLKVGICGGFTTFSTFSADAVRLLRAGDYGPATAYIALSVAVCIAFAALGMWIGAQIARN